MLGSKKQNKNGKRPKRNHYQNRNSFSISREIREGIIRCILATDMARHNEILSQFQEISPNFDYSNQAHVNLVGITFHYR